MFAPKRTDTLMRAIAAQIEKEEYHIFEDAPITVCHLRLKNGTHYIGYSECIDKELFNTKRGQEMGKNTAFFNAIHNSWGDIDWDAVQTEYAKIKKEDELREFSTVNHTEWKEVYVRRQDQKI